MSNDDVLDYSKLSPIVIFAYNRFDKFTSLIESLKTNKECKFSDLYIFIDGIKNSKDIEENNKIILYSKSVAGFNEIYVKISKQNKGLANSIITGVGEVMNKYGKAIVLEDDLLVSNSFLNYMNKALDFYENDREVFSIAGYCPNIKTKNDDVFFYPRIESWGWASWIDRWNKVDWEVKDYQKFITNKEEIRNFNKGGKDLSNMLRMQQEGAVNSWAIRFCYAEYKDKSITVYPPKSLVNNMGCNETGTNFKESTNKYNVDIANDYVPNLVKYNGMSTNYKKMLNFYNNTRPEDYYRRIKNKVIKTLTKSKGPNND